jgi:hypothetical protein
MGVVVTSVVLSTSPTWPGVAGRLLNVTLGQFKTPKLLRSLSFILGWIFLTSTHEDIKIIIIGRKRLNRERKR